MCGDNYYTMRIQKSNIKFKSIRGDHFAIRQIGQKNLPDLSIYGNSFVYITLLRISGTAPRNTKMFRTNLLFRGVIALRAVPLQKNAQTAAPRFGTGRTRCPQMRRHPPAGGFSASGLLQKICTLPPGNVYDIRRFMRAQKGGYFAEISVKRPLGDRMFRAKLCARNGFAADQFVVQ